VSELSTRIPGAYFYVPEPSWLAILIYYAVLIGWLGGWLFAPGRRSGGAFALLLIAAGFGWHWQATRDEIKLTVLPLNGGHAVFLDAPGRKNDWLVNCGNENAVQFILKPFLRAQGVNRVPRLVLTHGDVQNIGGAELLNRLFGVGEIFTSPVQFRSRAYRDFVAAFDQPPARHQIVQCGDAAGGWQVLHPGSGDNFEPADNAALVLQGNWNGTRVLLLSDLGRKGQSALLARTHEPGADVVIAGLTGDGEPLCDALLDAVQPKIIVVADSESPATRRASRELKDRLGQRGVPVIYTREADAVTLVTRSGGWELRTMRGQRFTDRTLPEKPAGSRPALPPE
jgi:competence protein ComEC